LDIPSNLKLSVTHLPLSSAYLLVSHGSRDSRPQAALEQLAELLKLRFEGTKKVSPYPKNQRVSVVEMPSSLRLQKMLVGTATLELAPIPLHEQIQQFGQEVLAAGCRHLQILPLFLLPGVHVREDIPQEVAVAQQALGQQLTIDLRHHLGSHPELGRLFASQMTDLETEARILLSHGSRRQGGNQPVEAIATQLNAVPAYWSVSPNLESQVAAFVKAGYRQIAVLPYFLFSGGITDAIAQKVEHLKKQFPSVSLHLAAPLGASAELADLILDLTVA
jgi:sirohydrochlorin cobaltochelatase